MDSKGYAALSEKSKLEPFHFKRRSLRHNDVALDILFCGVCHSDLHQARNDWHGSQYPMVPGHEIVGVVTNIGADVKKYKIGDRVAVGCMVDSCMTCPSCQSNEEQFCFEGSTMTYNGADRVTGELTYGGYSNNLVVREEFLLGLPDNLDIKRAAPILCAGITTYSPLKKWGIKSGSKIGVVGLGGLGHMAVKLAVAMGADVTVITTSPHKEEDALALGAKRILVSKNEEELLKNRGQFEFILDTVPVDHDISPYLSLLETDGSLVLVGAIGELPSFHTFNLIGGRKRVSGSLIGGIKETQELLDFCGENQIYPDCEIIPIQKINDAFERMEKGDVKYRFVIDMSSLN